MMHKINNPFISCLILIFGFVFFIGEITKATVLEQQNSNTEILFTENFNSGISAWNVSGMGITNWAIKNEQKAGGQSPEVNMAYTPKFDGTSRFISPLIKTKGKSSLSIEFKHFLSNYKGNVVLKVETTSDGGSTWNEIWTQQVTNSNHVGPQRIYTLVSNSDVGSDSFQIAFSFSGNTSNINFWRIDDIIVAQSFNHDVTPIDIKPSSTTFKIGETIFPTAKVVNLGSTTASGTVNLVLKSSNTQIYSSEKSFNSLLSLDTTLINFDSWVSNVGGLISLEVKTSFQQDENTTNDILTNDFIVLSGIKRKWVVVEDFTGTWCQYCPGAAMGIDDLLENNYKIAPIAYHYRDSYETPTVLDRYFFYDSKVGGFPTVIFDGSNASYGGNHDVSLYEEYIPFVESAMEVPTPITVAISNLHFEGNKFTANATCVKVDNVGSKSLVLHAVITESHIDEEWQGQFELNDVLRQNFPNSNGTKIDLFNQQEVSIPLEFSFNEDWNKENCELIVYIQDTISQNIYNADKCDVMDTLYSNSLDLKENEFSLYPNPASEEIFFSKKINGTVQIFNLVGNLVYQEQNTKALNVSNLPNGIYIIRIFDNGRTITKTINVYK